MNEDFSISWSDFHFKHVEKSRFFNVIEFKLSFMLNNLTGPEVPSTYSFNNHNNYLFCMCHAWSFDFHCKA